MTMTAQISSLDLYTSTCMSSASRVISAYSTSFGASVQLLGRRHRHHVRNIYALVRIADELVDGVATQAGLPPARQRRLLDALESDTMTAVSEGFSTNPVVQAFAVTARQCGIEPGLITPFFASMREDITNRVGDGVRSYTSAEHAAYVHGSAEVVGLMCVRVFTRGATHTAAQRKAVTDGARALGAAFQNINFLRDLADDSTRLGRDYLNLESDLTQEQLRAWVATIFEQLDCARGALPLLPKDARRAVRCALDLFAALAVRLSRASIQQLYLERVRVPNPVKIALLARASTRTILERA